MQAIRLLERMRFVPLASTDNEKLVYALDATNRKLVD